jgi:hypothetical protein
LLGSAMMVLAALGAIGASGASASGLTWKISGSEMTQGFENGAAMACEGVTPFTLKLPIGTAEVTLTAQEAACTEAIVYNWAGHAYVSERLQLSQLTVSGAKAGCAVQEPILTNPLSGDMVLVPALPSGLAKKIVPTVVGGAFTTLHFLSSCGGLAGSYPIKGTIYAEAAPLGTESITQPLTFSPAINSAAGGSITFGTKPMSLTGELSTHLLGIGNGEKWGTFSN